MYQEKLHEKRFVELVNFIDVPSYSKQFVYKSFADAPPKQQNFSSVKLSWYTVVDKYNNYILNFPNIDYLYSIDCSIRIIILSTN